MAIEDSSQITFSISLSTFVAVCGSYIYGHSVGFSSPAVFGIMNETGLTDKEYSFFSSILTIGAMLGAILSGRIADLIGRRAVMGISEIFCISGWLAIAFSKVALWLDIGRFLVGCGIGLLSYVVPVYVAEITPKNFRGGFTALNPLMIGVGQSLAFLIGSLVSWRILALIGIVPGLIQLPGLFFIPESPRWLIKVGQSDKFEAALQRLRGANTDIFQEAAEIKNYTIQLHQITEDGILNLFQKKYIRSLIVGIGLMILQRFGGLYAFVFYASTIFKSAGFSVKVGSIIAAGVQLVATALGAVVIDKYGRLPLLLISTVGSAIGCLITGLSFLFLEHHLGKELCSILALTGVLLFLGFLQFGVGTVPWIIMSEIFPINIKGTAGSLVVLVSWIGSWIVSYTFNFLFKWSSAGTFFIYGAVNVVGVLFIAKMVPETKGRTLEEIQKSMTQSLQ